jgi:hypothetical protein
MSAPAGTPPATGAEYGRASKLVADKRFHEADSLLTGLIEAAPTDPRLRKLLGTSKYRSGNFGDALEAFHELIRLDDSNAMAHYSVAVTLLKLGRTDEARAALQNALARRPDMPEAQAKLAELNRGGGSAPLVAPSPGAVAEVGHQPAPSPDARSRGINEEETPGALRYDGYRLMRSYLGRFAIAATLSVIGLVGIARNSPDAYQQIGNRVAWVDFHTTAWQNAVDISGRTAATDASLRTLESARANASAWSHRVYTLVFVLCCGLVLVSVGLATHAVIDCERTRYRIYDRRIDVVRGVMRLVTESVWLYEVQESSLQEPLALQMVGTARIVVLTEKRTEQRPLMIVGTADKKKMDCLWREILSRSLPQRQKVKAALT